MVMHNSMESGMRPVKPVTWVQGEATNRADEPMDVAILKLQRQSQIMEYKTDEIGRMVAAIHNGVGHLGTHIFGTPQGAGYQQEVPRRNKVGFTSPTPERRSGDEVDSPSGPGIGF